MRSKQTSRSKWWRTFVNQQSFLNFSETAWYYCCIIGIGLLIFGLKLIINAPEDYQQGISVRIMYIHVPAAWLALTCYSLMALAAISILVWRPPLALILLRCAAPIGALLTSIALLTGSLWGYTSWGSWWEWDGRMSSVFILLLIYLGIIALGRSFTDHYKAGNAQAILTLVGAINLPIIKFSVLWWNSLHQPASILAFGKVAIAGDFLWPLITMFAAFCFLFLSLQLLAMNNMLRWRSLQQAKKQQRHRRLIQSLANHKG